MSKDGQPTETALLEEFKLCQSIVQHLNATYESVFLAGSLAATGFVLQNPTFLKLGAASSISIVVLLGLLALIKRGNLIQRECYARMNEIEEVLHLDIQHRLDRFNKDKKGKTQLQTFTRIIRIYLGLLVVFTIAKYPNLISSVRSALHF